jgi:hypothetical protein
MAHLLCIAQSVNLKYNPAGDATGLLASFTTIEYGSSA